MQRSTPPSRLPAPSARASRHARRGGGFATGLVLVLLGGIGAAQAASARALAPAGDGRLCTPDHQLCLRGTLDATGTRMTGTVAIETPLGDWRLEDAALVVDLDRPALDGTASVGLPALGLLDQMVATRARASIHIGFGGDQELSLGGRPFAPAADKFYVAAALAGDAAVTLGGVEMFKLDEGTSLLFEPTAPVIYADGITASFLGSALGLGGLEAFGLSLDDHACIPYTTRNPLLDRREGTAAPRSICGNMWIEGALSYDIFEGQGDILVDLDANGDGISVFEGQPRDFVIAGDTAAAIALPDVPRSIVLGGASYLYEGSIGSFGRLSFAQGIGREQMFEGTPLARFMPGPETRTSAVFDDAGQWIRFQNDQAILGGWKVSNVIADVAIAGTTTTFSLAGRLGLPGNTVAVSGTVSTNGDFRITGRQSLNFFDVAMQDASITLTNDGVALAGAASVRGPQLKIDASLTTRRDPTTYGSAQAVTPANFAVSGEASIKLRGRTLADGRLRASAAGLHIKGSAAYGGSKFKLEGNVTPSNFSLGADIGVSVSKNFDFGIGSKRVGADGEARFRISDDAFSVKFHGDVDPGGTVNLDIDGDGDICQKFKVSFGILGSISKTVCFNVL